MNKTQRQGNYPFSLSERSESKKSLYTMLLRVTGFVSIISPVWGFLTVLLGRVVLTESSDVVCRFVHVSGWRDDKFGKRLLFRHKDELLFECVEIQQQNLRAAIEKQPQRCLNSGEIKI